VKILADYPYLVCCLALLAIFGVCLLMNRSQRRAAVVAGVLGSPLSIVSPLFRPEYWDPICITDLPVSIEDVLFSFAAAGIAWILAVRPLDGRLTTDLGFKRSLARYTAWSIAGLAMALTGWSLGLGVMTAFLVAMVVLAPVLLIRRPELWPLAVAGGVGFGFVHTLVAIMILAVYPELGQQWTTSNLLGVKLRGLPIEEVLWAVGYGAIFPLMLGHSFDAGVRERPA
jgi:hypothetical protein